jgi:hypothetical protein
MRPKAEEPMSYDLLIRNRKVEPRGVRRTQSDLVPSDLVYKHRTGET